MRFQRLALSLSAALTLGFAPAAAGAQVIYSRGACYGGWDACSRRDDILLKVERARTKSTERAAERAAQAEERAQRLADAREARETSARFRAEDRAFTLRLQSERRARDLADRARERREQAELNRRLRLPPRAFRWQ